MLPGVREAICRAGFGWVPGVIISLAFLVGYYAWWTGSVLDLTVDLFCRVKRSKVVTLLASLLGTPVVYSCASYFLLSVCEPPYVKLAFETGPQQHTVQIYPPCYVNRSTVTQGLSTRMTEHRSGVYYVVLGPHGCGKSTALMEAVSVSPRTVYAEVSSDGDFPQTLATALSIDFGCFSGSLYDFLTLPSFAVRRKCPTTMQEHLSSILHIVKSVVADMEQPPTLVIDNLSALFAKPYDAAEGKDAIQRLQGFAKSMADKRLMSIVVAGSEGHLVPFLYHSSSASRLEYHLMTDLSFEEAVTYLTCMCPQTSVNVTDVVKLVGGRLIHLCLAAAKLKVLHTMEELKGVLFGLVRHELSDLKIDLQRPASDSSVLSNTTWNVAKALLDSPERTITYEHFSTLMKQLEEGPEKDNLLDSNILFIAYHTYVQFQSSLVQAYFEDLIT